MVEYEKLRESLARNMDADLWPMLDVALDNKLSIPWQEREASISLKNAESVMAVILSALQTPTPEMLEASILVDELATRDWRAILNASPLVKP